MHRNFQVGISVLVALVLFFLLLPKQYVYTPQLPNITWIDSVSNATRNLAAQEEELAQTSTVTVTSTATVTQEVKVSAGSREASSSSDQPSAAERSPAPKGYPGPREAKVALFETNGWHDEVVASLIHSLGSQSQVDLRIFHQRFRYGIQDVLAKFKLARPMPAYEKWQTFMEEEHYVPDVMVMTTCELDVTHLAPRLQKLIKEKKTFLFCIIHNSNVWFKPNKPLDIIKPWAKEGLIDFVVLSEAVIETVKTQGMQSWPRSGPDNISRTVRYYAPIFPAHLPSVSAMVEEEKRKDTRGNDSFAMQGIFSSNRRNYGETFKNLQRFIDDRADQNKASDASTSPAGQNDRNIQLQILGHLEGAPPTIPEKLKDSVQFHDSLNYTDFYRILSQQFAILPAFADDKYLWKKASSSIAASFISGTPIVADQSILKAYSYIGEDAVYLQGANETDFDVLRRVLAGPVEWRVEKTKRVRERAEQVIEENKSKMKAWITEAGARTGFFR